MTLVSACRDTVCVIRAECGAQPEELKPGLDEIEILSGKLDEVWHDGWAGCAPLVYENEYTIVHSEEFVTDEDLHQSFRMPLVTRGLVASEIPRSFQVRITGVRTNL